MNYILSLKGTVAKLEDEKNILLQGYNQIISYLHSEKFSGVENNYVNPGDILLRIREILSEYGDIEAKAIETDYNLGLHYEKEKLK